MASKGSVRFIIGAETAGMSRGLRNAEREMKGFGQKVERIGKFGGAGLGGIAAGLTSIGGAAAFIGESATATMDLYKSTLALSRVTGYDTQTASAWVSMAKARGIGSEQLTRSYTTLAKQIRAAQQGGSSAVATFSQLGVSQRDLAKGNTAQILGKVADGLRAHANGAGKAAVASQLFGRSYSGMLGILNRGSRGVNELVREEEKHGPVLSGNTKALAKAREQQLRFTESMEKLKVTIGAAVLPVIGKLADRLSKWLDAGANKKRIDELVKAFAGLAGQAMQVGKLLIPMISSVTKFVGKHPEMLKIIADMVALKLAIRAISFLNPTRGLLGFMVNVGKLGKVGKTAGGAMATGIASAFPKLASWMATVFDRLGAALGLKFASRFAAQLGGSAAGSAATGGGGFLSGLLGGIVGGAKWLGRGALKVLTTGAGLAAAGVTAFGMTFNSFADDGTQAIPGQERDQNAWMASHGMWNGRRYHNMRDWLAARRRFPARSGGRVAGMSVSDAVGNLPNFSFSAADTSSPSRHKAAAHVHTANSPDQLLLAATKLAGWSRTIDEQLSKSSNSLWARGIDPNSAKGRAAGQAILQQGVSKWPSVRGQLNRLAAIAAEQGHHATLVKITDFIHRGDLKQLEYKAHLAQSKARGKAATAPVAPQISGAQLSEEAFIRAAFAPGDIGSGGLNAWLAAGGAPTGLNSIAGSNTVNVTIQSLHPGDGATKTAIASSVVKALHSQGKRPRVRSTAGR